MKIRGLFMLFYIMVMVHNLDIIEGVKIIFIMAEFVF
jgi:hypothetical protein